MGTKVILYNNKNNYKNNKKYKKGVIK